MDISSIEGGKILTASGIASNCLSTDAILSQQISNETILSSTLQLVSTRDIYVAGTYSIQTVCQIPLWAV